uniref:Mucus protein n=1 Tax=Cornu aspersum TaxID=6535 RepID=A0A6B7KL98_CORAP|nr:mucus protein [Cornu aspersum]
MSLAIFVGVAIYAAAAAAQEFIGNVAFTAAFTEDTSVAEGRLVQYPVVFTNHGSGYNSNTGIFIATKGGLYVFHIHGQPTAGNDFSLTLYHNDNPIITASGRQQGDNVGTGSNSVTLRLKKNDRVSVKADIRSSLRGSSDSVFSTFSGYLIGLLTSSEL